MQTETCILCTEPAIVWCGHVHASGSEEKTLAGWCALHLEQMRTAMSSVLPCIAEAFPGRAKVWEKLTANARLHCLGCFGDFDSEFNGFQMELEVE